MYYVYVIPIKMSTRRIDCWYADERKIWKWQPDQALVDAFRGKHMVRPEPVPSRETAPFWDAAKDGRLRLPKCETCNSFYYPPLPRCPTCHRAEMDWQDLSGKATILSWTRVHLPTIPGVKPPFTLAEISLVEQPGVTIVALVQEALAPNLITGMYVQIVFAEDGNYTFAEIAEVAE